MPDRWRVWEINKVSGFKTFCAAKCLLLTKPFGTGQYGKAGLPWPPGSDNEWGSIPLLLPLVPALNTHTRPCSQYPPFQRAPGYPGGTNVYGFFKHSLKIINPEENDISHAGSNL